jgi:hypothetical protein
LTTEQRVVEDQNLTPFDFPTALTQTLVIGSGADMLTEGEDGLPKVALLGDVVRRLIENGRPLDVYQASESVSEGVVALESVTAETFEDKWPSLQFDGSPAVMPAIQLARLRFGEKHQGDGQRQVVDLALAGPVPDLASLSAWINSGACHVILMAFGEEAAVQARDLAEENREHVRLFVFTDEDPITINDALLAVTGQGA